MPPKAIAKSNERPGVLPIPAAARAPAHNKQATARLKLEVRRLPPGLTLTEFEQTLGPEWALNAGRVDWREYRQGKLKAPGKLPEQSRCYLHLTSEAHVRDFEQRFLAVVFHDKAGTYRHSELKHLPPTVGYAPHQRTPLQSKSRVDTRQGTIDQDPEFIAFLEAETLPIVRPAGLDLAELVGEKEKVVVTSTPLIEDLRERKANKAKAAAEKAEKALAAAKADKAKKAEDAKKATAVEKEAKAVAKSKDEKVTSQQVEQAAKEAARLLTRQANSANNKAQQTTPTAPTPTPQAQTNAKTTPATTPRSKKPAQSPRQQNATPASTSSGAAAASSTSSSPAPNRVPPTQRQRASAEGIKKMLQKDLGIRPKPAATPNTAPSTKPAPGATPSAVTTNSASPSASASAPPSKAPSSNNATAAPAPAPTPPSAPASPPVSLYKAYLKHANPSQGMTEMLIQRALAQYGDVNHVTIDPRRGTAIAVFKDAEGLKKALEIKRVPVARGEVEVLEFRDAASAGRGGPMIRGGRGGFRGGRGGMGARGGNVAAAASSPTTKNSSAPATSSPTATASTSTPAPPPATDTPKPVAAVVNADLASANVGASTS